MANSKCHGEVARIQYQGAIYHISARGNERRLIFRDARDRERFLKKLTQSGEIYQARIYLVCLMPNHFHLLLQTPAGNLSELMGRFLSCEAIYFKCITSRRG